MKLLLFGLLLIAQASFAQNPFSPYNEIKPKGPVDSVIIDYGDDLGKRVYIYNKTKQLVKVINYTDEALQHNLGRFLDTLTTKFTYSDEGRLLSSIYFHNGDTGTANYEYITTDYGYNIRALSATDSLVYEMRFNTLGQMIQNGTYSRNKLAQQHDGNVDYRYDKKGNLSEITSYWDWKKLKPIKQFYKYDNFNDVIAITGEYKSPQDRTFTYPKYDQRHNWTERIFRNGNGSTHTSYRRITYHK